MTTLAPLTNDIAPLPQETVACFQGQEEQLRTAVADALQTHIFHNSGYLGSIRSIPPVSKQIVETFIQVLRTETQEELVDHVTTLVKQGLGPETALAVIDALHQAGHDLLEEKEEGDLSRAHQAVDFYRRHFLYLFMEARYLQAMRDHERIHQGLSKSLNEQVQQERKLRDELEKERSLLDNIIDNIPNPTFYKDTDGAYQGFNQAFLDYLGLTAEEVLGKTVYDLNTDQELADRYHQMDQELFDHPEESQVYEEEIVYADDTRHEVIFNKSVFYDNRGEVAGLVGTMVDITDRKEAEEALRRNEARLRVATRLANLYSWEFDFATGEFTFGDDYLELLGVTPQDESDYRISAEAYAQEYMPPKLAEEVGGEVAAAVATDDPDYSRVFESEIITKDGQLIPLRIRFNVVKDEAGNTVKLVGANQDIREEKKAEAALAKQAEELQTVAEVATTAATTLEEEELLQDVVDLTKQRFDLYHTHIYLLDETGEDLVLAAGAGGVGEQMVAEGRSIPLTRQQSLVARAARNRQGVIVNDVQADPGFLPHPLLPDTCAEMAVPMIVGDEVLGVLDVQADEVDRFTDQDVQIQTTLAAQTAVALQNARQYEQTQQALEQAQEAEQAVQHRAAIQKVGAEISSNFLNLPAEEIDSGIDQALEMVGELAHVDRAYLFLFSEDQAQMSNTNEWTAPGIEPQIDELQGLPTAEFDFLMSSIKNLETFYVPQVADMPDSAQVEREEFEREGIQSIICEPLLSYDEAIGFIGFDAVQQEVKWQEEDIALLRLVSDVLVSALRREETERELRAAQEQAQSVLESVTTPLLISSPGDGRILYANERLATLLKQPLDNLIGSQTPNFYADSADRRQIVTTLQERGEIKNYELELKRENGESFWVLLSARMFEYDDEMTILTSMIDITERREAQAALAKQAEELQTVADVSTAVSTTLDQQALLQNVVDLTQSRFDLYHAHIYLLDEAAGELMLSAGAGEVGRQMVNEGRAIPLDREQSLVARAARTQQGVIVNNVQADPGFLSNPLLPDTRAEMAVPMIVGNKLLGVLDVQADEVDRFTTQDVQIKTTLAAQTAVALQNARQYQRTQEALEEASIFRQLVESTGQGIGITNLNGVLTYLNPALADLLGLPDPAAGEGRFVAEMYAEDVQEDINEEVMPTVMEEGEWRGQRSLISQDGREIPTLQSVFVVRDENGKPAYLGSSVIDISERKAAEEALRENEARLAEAVEMTKLYYWEFDFATQEFEFTPEYYEFLGTTAEAEGGYRMSAPEYAQKYVHPEDGPVVGQEVQKAVASDDPNYSRQFEARNVMVDGRIVPVRVRFRLIRDADGNPLKMIGANQDITEQKEAERELQRREELLSTIINSTPDWIFVKDRQHRYVLVNQGYADSLGMEPEEFIGKNDLELGFPEDIVKGNPEEGIVGFWPDDNEVMAADEMKVIDEEPAVVDGEQRYLNTIKSPLHNTEGEVIGVVGFVHDITDRKQVELALRENEARLAEAVEMTKLYYWEFDLATQEFEFTPEYYEFLGTSVETEGGYRMSVADFSRKYVHPEDAPLVAQEMQEAVATGVSAYGREFRNVTADGEVIPVLVRFRIMYDADGNPMKIIGANQDITEQKEAEAAIAKLAEELQTVADVSTAVSTTLDQKELLQDVVDLTKARFQLYHAHIYLLDSAGEALMLTAGAGEVGSQMVQERRRIPFDQEQSLVARAARTRTGVIVNDVQSDPQFLPHPLLPETRAEMAVPMVVGNDLLGVLDVQADEADYFTAQDVKIHSTLAAQTAIALQNARQFEQTEQAMQELNALTRRLTREGWQEYEAQQGQELAFLYNSDQFRDAEALTAVEAPSSGNGHQLVQSLTIHGEEIGQLTIEPEEDGSDEYDTETAEIIAAVADQLSAHIENLRLTEQTQVALAETEEQAMRLAQLNEMAAALNAAEELDEIFQIAVDQVLDVVGGTRASIALVEEKTKDLEVMAVSGVDSVAPSGARIPLAQEAGIKTAVNEMRVVIDQASTVKQQIGEGLQSTIIAPLITSSQVLGTLNVGSEAGNAFDQNDENLIQQVGAILVSTVENRRLLDETRQRAEQLGAINRVSQSLSQYLDRDKLLEAAHDQVLQALDANAFFIGLYDAEEEVLNYPLISEKGKRSEEWGRPLNPQSNSYQVIMSGEPVMQNLSPAEREELQTGSPTLIGDNHDYEIPASLLYVPLRAGQRILGVLSAQNYRFNAYTQNDLNLLSGIAGYLAIALENVRLFDETQQRAQQLQALSQVETELSQAITEEDIVSAVASGLATDEDTAIALYYIQSDAAGKPQTLHPMAMWADGGIQKDSAHIQHPVPFQAYPTSQLLLDRPFDVFYISDIFADERVDEATRALSEQQGIGGTAGMPLRSGGRWQGVLVFNWPEPHTFTEKERFLMENLLEPIAAVVSSRRALLAQQEALDETATLYEASAALNSARSYEEILVVLREHTIAGDGAHVVSLNHFDRPWTPGQMPEWIMVLAANIESDEVVVAPQYKLDHFPAAQQVLKADEPTLIESVATDPSLDENARALYLEQFQGRSTLFAPLTIAGRWVGYINAIYGEERTFPEDEIRRLMALAGQSAVAVSNRRLLEQTQQRASYLERLAQVELDLSQAVTEEEILTVITTIAEQPETLKRASLSYIEHDENNQPVSVSLQATWADGAILTDSPLLNQPVPLDEYPTSKLWMNNPNEVTFISDVQQSEQIDEFSRQRAEAAGLHATALIPLRSGGRWRGVINLLWSEPDGFGETERFILPQLMDSLAAVVASRRAQLAQQQARHEAETLYETSQRINEASNTTGILAAVMERIEVESINRAVVMRFKAVEDEDRGYQEVTATWYSGEGRPPNPVGTRYPLEAVIGMDIAKDPQPVFIPDTEHLDERAFEFTQRLDIRSMVILPLLSGNQPVGVIVMLGERPTTFEATTRRIISSLAPQVAIALENKRLLADTEARARREQLLRQITARVRGSADVDTIMRTAVQEIGRSLGRKAFIYVSDDDEFEKTE